MADCSSYFAPLKKSCREEGTASLLPEASAFIQSDSYASKVKELQAESSIGCVTYDDRFAEWELELRANFSIILYGVGCKRALLAQFAEQCLTEGGLVEINAWRGKLNAKQIVIAVLSSLSGMEARQFRTMSTEAMLKRIAAESGAGMWVNLVIHSLDARFLRQEMEHATLSRLAECRAVRMIASADHPDTCLLHNFETSQRTHICWHHVPTLLPLWSETWEIEPSLQPRKLGEARLDAVPVLQTLTQNSQQVFCTLISALLGELLDDDDEVTGVTYEHLFRVCRERLLVSSDETLKAHLTEYKDHDLLKRRKTQDGVELLYIPLPVAELQKLLDVLQGPTGEA